MSTLWKLVKSSGRSHEKTKLDPDSGTRYCPCDYHEQKQKAKKKKLTALGVKDSVNYYDRDGYHNRPPHHHKQNPDDLYHDHHSDYDYSQSYSSQSHDHHGHSTSSRPEPELRCISSYISGGAEYNGGNYGPESATGIESEYHYSAHENGFPVDEPDGGNWRFGDYSFDRDQWEANSAQQFYHFVRGDGRH